ncbi:MAG: hypothetical protein LBL65_07575 [Campylobacteraceae bacterium]|jgi:hypothetical protein|nr:hypothetical protein [Campylobacteraceae bacterium]
MAYKKHKLSTLIKVGFITLFSVIYEISLMITNPKYDKHNKKMFYLIKLNLIIFAAGVTATAIASIFLGEKSEIVFIIFLAIIFINIIYGIFCTIKQAFQIWRTLFKEYLEKEDKQE